MCIPESLQEKAFRICHAHPISGHLGINKTSGLLAERFYWPNLYTFAKARILNCVPCLCKRQTFETGRHKMYREPLSYINQRVYADAMSLSLSLSSFSSVFFCLFLILFEFSNCYI